MFVLRVDNKEHKVNNTLCKEGMFTFLQGFMREIRFLRIAPINGASVSFYDQYASHPNWVFNPDITFSGGIGWPDPPVGGRIESNEKTFQVVNETTIDGLALHTVALELVAVALFPGGGVVVKPSNFVCAKFILQGTAVSS